MPRLIATSTYSYAGKTIKSGDEFEAPEKDSALLKLIGKAKDAKPTRTYLDAIGPAIGSRLGKATLETRHVEADSPEPARVKRQYRRRDLSAEP